LANSQLNKAKHISFDGFVSLDNSKYRRFGLINLRRKVTHIADQYYRWALST